VYRSIIFGYLAFAEVDQLKNTVWACHIEQLNHRLHEPFFIRDYTCNELETLLSSPDLDYQLCVKLMDHLNKNYAEMHHAMSAAVLRSRFAKSAKPRPELDFPSSFSRSLCKHAWIPVGEGKLMKPNGVYLLSEHQRILHRYVPHVDSSRVALQQKDPLVGALGLRCEIAKRTLFNLFMKWSCDLDEKSVDQLIQSTHPSDM
jgi:hypothetical protein